MTYNRVEWIDHCDNMKNDKDDQAIHCGEQTPEVLSRNLKILGKGVIEFSVKNMIITQPGVIKETGISFKLDEHKNAIGVIKPKIIDEDHVRQSFREIDKTVNILSLLYDVGDWMPQSLSEFQIKTSITRLMNQTHLTRVDEVFRSISEEMNDREREIYFRALEWYRHGINSKSLFNSFLAFYNSVELFSDGYYYSKHRSEIRRSKTEKGDCIQKYFKDLSIMSISEIGRKHINDCYEKCLETSSKDKMILAFEKVFDGNKEKISKFSMKFFEENSNLKSIRNDIAHGNLSEYKEDDRSLVKENLFEIQYMAKEFLIKIIS